MESGNDDREHMSDVVEWEWRVEDPAAHPILDVSQVHGLYVLGQLWAIVALKEADDSDDQVDWQYWTAPDPDDGWSGYEHIDGFETLEAAQASIAEDREEILQIVRDGLESN